MTADESYMDMALELAKRGMGAVNPNPLEHRGRDDLCDA